MKLHERFGRVSDYDLVVRATDVPADGAGNGYLESPGAAPLSVMERTERVDRYLLDCGVGADGPLTDKTSLDVIYDYAADCTASLPHSPWPVFCFQHLAILAYAGALLDPEGIAAPLGDSLRRR
jgi:hypothetical protein